MNNITKKELAIASIAVFTALLIRTNVFAIATVHSENLSPILSAGDKTIINKLDKNVTTGDIVLSSKLNGSVFVKLFSSVLRLNQGVNQINYSRFCTLG